MSQLINFKNTGKNYQLKRRMTFLDSKSFKMSNIVKWNPSTSQQYDCGVPLREILL